MKKIEILAPAGSYESLVAAVNASCDAVYIGGTKFGARAYADNLAEDNMQRAIDYVHIHDKKIYMTVNTLLKNSELEEDLYDYLQLYYRQGLDAVIVQDPGVLQFIHENFPELPIHASTQMTLTMAEGANVLKDKGVTRIVTSRELGLEEIKAIRNGTELEIESFVHGALCYCYSGQCLMSSMIGGRSGNRGRCAQPCRMPYQLTGDGKNLTSAEEKYLLSPKDICTIDMIPDLVEAGIDSFKIEGRMKRPEYTAGVTAAYRKYTDKYLELGKEKYELYRQTHKEEITQDIMDLKDLYNRGGFTQGYYKERNGRDMISMYRPNHSGVLVGKVTDIKGSQAVIRLEEDIHGQDVLEIRNTIESLYEFTVKADELKGKSYTANLGKVTNVRKGNVVYRTKNNRLLHELSEKYLEAGDKIPVTGFLTVYPGEPLKLNLTCRDISVEVYGDTVQEAQNQPMTEDKIKKQLLKTGDTDFVFQELNITINGNAFIPVQKLNELRRSSLEALWLAAAEKHRRILPDKNNDVSPACEAEEFITKLPRNRVRSSDNTRELGICAAVSTREQAMAACELKEVADIYLESDAVPFSELLELTGHIKQQGKNCYIILPHIFRRVTWQYFLQNKNILTDNTINGYILRNYEAYSFAARELKGTEPGKEFITDYNLYVMNRFAARFWQELGVTRFTAPVELNSNELKELKSVYSDLIVYGYLPLMVSAQCLVKTAAGGNSTHLAKALENPCCKKDITDVRLTDRYQKEMRIKRHCRDCYNTIYNSQSLSLLSNAKEIGDLGVKSIRLNFTFESSWETKRILGAYIETYRYNSSSAQEIMNYTRGHFKRGIE